VITPGTGNTYGGDWLSPKFAHLRLLCREDF
jgi:hypothetical protein